MLTTLLSPCNLPTPVNWKAFVECLPQGRPRPAMTTFKHSFHLISAPLANIINLSLRKGIFPDKLKIAKVIPTYKADDPIHFKNYRPISL